jgi:hypothetical protein
MENGFGMEPVVAREEIVSLEARIEALSAKIENCRKFIIASRAAVAVGGVLLLAALIGAVRADGMILAIGVIGTIGGLVLMGSNSSTAKEATAQLAEVEARRAELINMIDLRVVEADGAATVLR